MKRPRLQFKLASLMIVIVFAAIPFDYYSELNRSKARQKAESLAKSKRFGDVYLLDQPYILKANEPKSPTSWAIGVTVSPSAHTRSVAAGKAQSPAP